MNHGLRPLFAPQIIGRFARGTGLTGWTGFYPVDHTAEKLQTRMAENAETKQLKANCKASAVIEQDLIQQHPENPVNPVKKTHRSATIKIYEEPLIFTYQH